MPTRARPVEPCPSLPAAADVVIVGGGIIGVSTAFFLARKGISVAICEKGEIAGEQSSRNWGWCRTMARDPREVPLALESLRIWGDLNQMVKAEVGFRRSGILYLCRTEKELDVLRASLEATRGSGLDARVVTPAEIAQIVPGSAQPWIGGVYAASDGRAEPETATPAIADAVKRLGGSVLTNCAVRGIEFTGGRVSSVVTERGEIACQSVVIAGGVWSGLLCRSLGIRFPQLKMRSSVMRTSPVAGAPEVSTTGSGYGFGFRKRLDGGYSVASGLSVHVPIVPDSFRYFWDFLPVLKAEFGAVHLRLDESFLADLENSRPWALDTVSPFERTRILDPKPMQRDLDSARRSLVAAFPAFKEMRMLESWGGIIDATPDAVPVIAPVEGKPGLFLSSGYTGHGFGLGPGAGRLTADLVSGDTPVVDPAAFTLTRLDKGRSRILQGDLIGGQNNRKL